MRIKLALVLLAGAVVCVRKFGRLWGSMISQKPYFANRQGKPSRAYLPGRGVFAGLFLVGRGKLGQHSRYVFRASRDAHRSITRLYDFVHPTAISLWNLRWQVQGYLSSVLNADSRMLEARFASGSGIGAGSLRRATVDTSWSNQLENFSSFILINTVAIFEDFVSTLVERSHVEKSQSRSIEKQLQFPSSSKNGGLKGALALLGESNLVVGCVTWDNSIARRIDEKNIEQLLICFRYFKELRNSLSHDGGRTSQVQLDVQAEFLNCIQNQKIGSVNAPEYLLARSIGEPAKISYRGVIGFSEVVLHIIATYDSILSRTPLVEKELKATLKPDKATWPTDKKAIMRRFLRLFDQGMFPRFSPSPTLVKFLKSVGIIPQSVEI